MSDGIAARAGATGAFFRLAAVVRGVDGADEAFIVVLCARTKECAVRALAAGVGVLTDA